MKYSNIIKFFLILLSLILLSRCSPDRDNFSGMYVWSGGDSIIFDSIEVRNDTMFVHSTLSDYWEYYWPIEISNDTLILQIDTFPFPYRNQIFVSFVSLNRNGEIYFADIVLDTNFQFLHTIEEVKSSLRKVK